MLGAAFCGIATGVLTFPIQLIGPQMHNLRAEFGWSELGVATSGACIGVGLAIGSPIAGWLLDRFGARLTALSSMAMLVALMVSLSQIGPVIYWFYLLYFLIGLLCSGSGVATYTRALGSWFLKARGFALGVALSGTGVAVFAAPILANAIERQLGWRAVYTCTGALVLLTMPFVAFGLRTQKSEPVRRDRRTSDGPPLHAWFDTIRDKRFILLAVSLALFGIVLGGTTIRFVPMLRSFGFSGEYAARLSSVLGLALIVGRLGIGALIDRMSAASLAAITFILAATGCLVFAVGGAQFAVFPIVTIGLVWGAEYDILSFVVMKYYGVANYGSIFGALFSIFIFMGLGTVFLTSYLVSIGGYSLLFVVNAACYALIAVAFLGLRLIDGSRAEVVLAVKA